MENKNNMELKNIGELSFNEISFNNQEGVRNSEESESDYSEESENSHSGEAKSNPIEIKRKSNRSHIPTWKEYIRAGMLKNIHNNSRDF